MSLKKSSGSTVIETENKENFEIINVCLIGDRSAVGKTKLLRRLVDDSYDRFSDPGPTIGIELEVKTHKKNKVYLCEPSSQECFRPLLERKARFLAYQKS